MRVAEPCRDFDFPYEALGSDSRPQFGAEHFECDLAVMLQVLGKVNDGHAAGANLAFNCVSVGKSGVETIDLVSHRMVSREEGLAHDTAQTIQQLELENVGRG